MESTPARERLLNVAERLFSERGYRGVTVKDIAREMGIHHATLYHHAPSGKQGLYVEIMRRSIAGFAWGAT